MFLQMQRPPKRQRAEEESAVDPVYPFEEVVTAPLPPFIDVGSGLESEGLKLSLNVSSPLTFRNNAVTLKLGSGLSIAGDGSLEASAASSVSPPLTNSGGELGLAVGDGLSVSNGTLQAVAPSAPLSYSGGHLQLSTGPGLTVSNGALQTAVTAPLLQSESGIGLSLGYGLSLSGNALVTTSPVMLAQHGWPDFDNFSQLTIISSTGDTFPVSGFCRRYNMNQIVTTVVGLKLDTTKWTSYGSTSPTSDFVFRMEQFYSTPTVYQPPNLQNPNYYFWPDKCVSSNNTTHTSTSFSVPPSGLVTSFIPSCDGSWESQFETSTCTVSFAPPPNGEYGGILLHFSMKNAAGQTASIFSPNIAATMIITPIVFTYIARRSL